MSAKKQVPEPVVVVPNGMSRHMTARSRILEDRAARQLELIQAALVRAGNARSAAGKRTGDPLVFALLKEVIFELRVDEATLTVADAKGTGRLYRSALVRQGPNGTHPFHDAHQRDTAVLRNGVQRLAAPMSHDVPEAAGSPSAPSSLRAYSYVPGRSAPAASLGVHASERRTFDAADVAFVHAMADLLASPGAR